MIIKYQYTTLNKYIAAERSHRQKAAKIKRDETFATKMMLLGKAKLKTPCGIRFTWHIKNRRTDPDNIAFAKKFILDGMVAANLIPNDTMKHITHFEDKFIISKWVGVEIERL